MVTKTIRQRKKLIAAPAAHTPTGNGEVKATTILPVQRAYEPETNLATLSLDDLSTSSEVYNSEFTWLDFNWRVLHEALDQRTPLLERLKFLAITASNLD